MKNNIKLTKKEILTLIDLLNESLENAITNNDSEQMEQLTMINSKLAMMIIFNNIEK